jgi:hypothetical protein
MVIFSNLQMESILFEVGTGRTVAYTLMVVAFEAAVLAGGLPARQPMRGDPAPTTAQDRVLPVARLGR